MRFLEDHWVCARCSAEVSAPAGARWTTTLIAGRGGQMLRAVVVNRHVVHRCTNRASRRSLVWGRPPLPRAMAMATGSAFRPRGLG
ncbi:MAG TPA: hypothetical protein VGI86_15555 [Acidimicrobiia bacterium]|jgi:hypothetical protein